MANCFYCNSYCLCYICQKCNKKVCYDCLGILGCNKTVILCNNCFDYKCICNCNCKNFLDEDIVYIYEGEPIPLCDNCIKKCIEWIETNPKNIVK